MADDGAAAASKDGMRVRFYVCVGHQNAARSVRKRKRSRTRRRV
jgi:hypothetical protein